MFYTNAYGSPLGTLTLAGDGEHLTGLWIEGQKYYGGSILSSALEREDAAPFPQVVKWLERYFSGERPQIEELPLAPGGSEFQRRVWKLLCAIPYGAVTTYGALAKEVAAQMGREHMSAQAVGGAVGHNPISIIIPCHRVLGADGGLTGYAGGIDRKKWLLEHEGAIKASAWDCEAAEGMSHEAEI